MNLLVNRCASRQLLAAAATALLLLANPPALAAPGAHGPSGEHLDTPTPMRAASALPRVEAHSEAFELVAELRVTELVIVIDRYESNEPVLGAKLEVESGTHKAVATFRAERGDYVVTDAALLKTLTAPGEHGLVFTLVAGQDSDLLDGTLVNRTGGDDPGHDNDRDHALERNAWIGAGVAALGLLGGIAWWRKRQRQRQRQRRRDAGTLQGGL